MSDLPSRADVVIIGAGPTGLTLAATLAARGVMPVLIDRLAEGENTSRAAVVHARTLEVLEELGVSNDLRARGVVVSRFMVRDRDRILLRVRFDGLPTPYPYTLMIPQSTTEEILLQRLRALGGRVHRPFAVTALSPDDDGVTVTVAPEGGPARTIRARYAAGADGMHSIAREAAGIGFSGSAYRESFMLADVRMTWGLGGDDVALFFAPEGLVVVAPLPGGRHRIVATMEDAPERPGREDVQRLLDARGPITGAARVDEIVWSSRFHVHHRIADRFRAGRIVLAGDAAHVHSPAGGQGMNTGIQDAVALGHALAAIAGGAADDRALDEYERTRRPVAQRVVSLTDRLTRVATLRGRSRRAARNAALRLAGRIPAFRNALATELAELRYR